MILWFHKKIYNICPVFPVFNNYSESNDISFNRAFLYFKEENLDIIRHMRHNALPFALEVADLSEVVFAHNLGAKYILVNEPLAKPAQKVAENYLFDAKILFRLENISELEEKIIEGIDGVIFPEAIVKISG